MAAQLDILALEPFYGGPRQAMLESMLRHSRHRWTLLKLPPRRIERRLAAAAHWFAEQLSRHWVGRVDLVFASEAMNLADLMRLVPALGGRPTIVYFHENQLPAPDERAESPIHLVNLSTASAATEIWFNSLYHLRTFLKRASSLIEKHPELSGRSIMPQLTAKAQLMPPPVELTACFDVVESRKIERDGRLIFVDTRGADVALLNEGLAMLRRRGEEFRLVTVGPLDGLDAELPRTTISEKDETAQILALHEAAVIVSARPGAPADLHALRALHVGCWPIFPDTGVYAELLPRSLHSLCLYDGSVPERLVTQLQNVWWVERPTDYQGELASILNRYSASIAAKAIDDRLEELVIAHSVTSSD